MKEKRLLQDWKIAMIHAGLGGLSIPFVLNSIFSVVYGIIFFTILPSSRTLDQYSSIFFVSGEIVLVVFVWLGVFLSSRLINSQFVLANKKSIVGIATAIYFSFEFIFLGWTLLMGDWTKGVFNLLLSVGAFYFSSLIYIKASEQQVSVSKNVGVMQGEVPSASTEADAISSWKIFFIAIFTIITIHLFFHAIFLYKLNHIQLYADDTALEREFKLNPEQFTSDKYELWYNRDPYYKFHYFPGRVCYIHPTKETDFLIRAHNNFDEFFCATLFSFPIVLGYSVGILFMYLFFFGTLLVSRVRKYENLYRLSKYVLIVYTGILIVVAAYIWLAIQIVSNMQIL